jgi:hypothetical protein
MEKDNLTDVDAVNVLRAGIVREAEWENGSWRHRIETARMVFVVTIDPDPDMVPGKDEDLGDMEIVVVTGWRTKN